MTRALESRIAMMVGRGTVAGVDDDRQLQELQLELLADEVHDGVEHFQTYGLTSHPKPGAEAVSVAVGGTRGHVIVIAVGDRRYRLKGLAEGEVALHDDQGQSVLLGRDGIVVSGKALTFESDGAIEFTGDSFTVNASGAMAFNGDDIAIGNGAILQAARKTDAVASSAISGGSSKVKIA
ncbi:hypothetical protein BH09PSE4_BH09PSE4_23110 [soil metagenome]